MNPKLKIGRLYKWNSIGQVIKMSEKSLTILWLTRDGITINYDREVVEGYIFYEVKSYGEL